MSASSQNFLCCEQFSLFLFTSFFLFLSQNNMGNSHGYLDPIFCPGVHTTRNCWKATTDSWVTPKGVTTSHWRNGRVGQPIRPSRLRPNPVHRYDRGFLSSLHYLVVAAHGHPSSHHAPLAYRVSSHPNSRENQQDAWVLRGKWHLLGACGQQSRVWPHRHRYPRPIVGKVGSQSHRPFRGLQCTNDVQQYDKAEFFHGHELLAKTMASHGCLGANREGDRTLQGSLCARLLPSWLVDEEGWAMRRQHCNPWLHLNRLATALQCFCNMCLHVIGWGSGVIL